MTETQAHDIFVDADRWSGTRAALADAVALQTGIPAAQVMAMLDVPGTAVTSVGNESAGEVMVAALQAVGVQASSRPRGNRPSLVELTQRSGPPVPMPAPPLLQTDAAEPSSSTLIGRAAPPDPDATVILDPRQNKLQGGSAAVVAPSAATLSDVEQGPASLPPPPLVPASAPSSRLPPPALPAPPGPSAPPVTPPKAATPLSPFKQTLIQGAGESAGAAEVDSREEPAAPVQPPIESSARAVDVPPARSGWDALLGAALQEPLVDEVPARAVVRPSGPAVPAKPAAAASVAAPDAASAGSAWDAVAGDATVIFDNDIGGGGDTMAPSRMVAPARPAEDAPVILGAAARDEEPGRPALFLRSETPAPPAAALSLASDTPTAKAAALWSLLAPGGGYVYLGELKRGARYALLSPLIIPWVVAALGAIREAGEIEQGTTLQRARGNAMSTGIFVVSFWAIVLGGIFVVNSVTAPRQAPTTVQRDALVPGGPAVNSEVAPQATPPPAPVAAEPAAEAQAEPWIGSEEERSLRIRVKLMDAERACNAGDWSLCRQLAEEVLTVDERNAEATRLQVLAVARGIRSPDPESAGDAP